MPKIAERGREGKREERNAINEAQMNFLSKLYDITKSEKQ